MEFSKHNSIEYYLAFLSVLPRPNLIMHFDIDSKVALKRYKIRGEAEKRDLTFLEIQNLNLDRFDFGKRLIEAVLQYYRSRNVEIITLKHDLDQSEVKLLFGQVQSYGAKNEKQNQKKDK